MIGILNLCLHYNSYNSYGSDKVAYNVLSQGRESDNTCTFDSCVLNRLVGLVYIYAILRGCTYLLLEQLVVCLTQWHCLQRAIQIQSKGLSLSPLKLYSLPPSLSLLLSPCPSLSLSLSRPHPHLPPTPPPSLTHLQQLSLLWFPWQLEVPPGVQLQTFAKIQRPWMCWPRPHHCRCRSTHILS